MLKVKLLLFLLSLLLLLLVLVLLLVLLIIMFIIISVIIVIISVIIIIIIIIISISITIIIAIVFIVIVYFNIFIQVVIYVSRHDEYQYLEGIQRIIAHGTRKEDRTGVGTISIFGMQFRYNLRESKKYNLIIKVWVPHNWNWPSISKIFFEILATWYHDYITFSILFFFNGDLDCPEAYNKKMFGSYYATLPSFCTLP